MGCVVALADLAVKSPRRTATYVLSLLTLAVVAGLQAYYASAGATVYGFGNMVVSDAMGKVVSVDFPASTRWTLDLSNLPLGIYSVEVRSGDRSETQKVVIR
jgi:hypothetical protein